MKKSCFKIIFGLLLIANISVCANAATKTRVITPSSPTVSESLKPIIKDYREGNYTQSMLKLEDLIQKEPHNAYANYYLALTYTRLGEKEKAQKFYNNVIALNTNMSLNYYSKKALACLDDPFAAQCLEIKSNNKPSDKLADKSEKPEEDDDMTKFIKSGKMIHPAAADAITRERMERKIQAEEYSRRQQENERESYAAPTQDEIIAAYEVLSRAGLNPYNMDISDLAYKSDSILSDNDDYELYAKLFSTNQQAAQMFMLNQLTQSQNTLNYGI